MTPAEEDALVLPLFDKRDHGDGTYTSFVPTEDDVRLAIRAAYAQGVAQERERCAKVCEEFEPKSFTTDGIITRAMCAAAIRRGE